MALVKVKAAKKNIWRTEVDFYCERCGILIFKPKKHKMVNVFTSTTGSIHCQNCDQFLGKIVVGR